MLPAFYHPVHVPGYQRSLPAGKFSHCGSGICFPEIFIPLNFDVRKNGASAKYHTFVGMMTGPDTCPFVLRPWRMEDLDHLVRFADNRKIAGNLTDAFPHPYTRDHGIEFITRAMQEDPPLIFAIEVEQIPCGAIGLHRQSDVHRMNAEMGYWLAEPFWGKGIMTGAVGQMVEYGFKTLDINRIFARPYSTNLASQRVLEKAGLRLEGRFAMALYKNGRYLDELIYSILRPV